MNTSNFSPVSWCYHTNIYEVNLRQYTPEGSFAAFEKHLARLAKMGVETLWFMPITPIGAVERLGSLGSYYACSSYVKTNPEFGTVDDFKKLVTTAHALGMKVIIDWVANHTGYGHEWMEGLRRDYYDLSPSGNFRERNGWKDVADLDYGNNDMRREMIESMQFWIKTCDIDGFRCDMAHLVPLEFWREARTKCEVLKPLFWLAETENEEYHEVFDATYAWEWMHTTERYFQEPLASTVLHKVLSKYQSNYPETALKMYFTSNHDENSWNGTEWEKYGDASLPLFAFGATYPGLPLMYSGQELPNTKRLKFFDKDAIEWQQPLKYEPFFTALLQLRKRNAAVGGNINTSPVHWLPVASERVVAFWRKAKTKQVLVLLNFSAEPQTVFVNEPELAAPFTDVFSNATLNFSVNKQVDLPAFGYMVLEKAKGKVK